ncbi:hypothetical protein ABH941_007474 [Streptacidiphilus sp. EB103A]
MVSTSSTGNRQLFADSPLYAVMVKHLAVANSAVSA